MPTTHRDILVEVPIHARPDQHSGLALVTSAAAILAVGLLAVVAAFQLALAMGAPWGAAAWGGQHPGVLPRRLRIASAVAGILTYPLLIVLVMDAAGWVPLSWLDGAGSLPMWILAGLLGIGALANFVSRSPRERIWGPVALITAVCCVILALNA